MSTPTATQQPSDSAANIIFGVLAGLIGLAFLALASAATDNVLYFHSLVAAVWSVLFIGFLIKRAYDRPSA
ncbi:MAG: hypothetical protein EAZ99_19535 [Alphaproteobacteria bacterium]|nr:hypothetical protein [Alphaproteobacteria bacterium]TAD86715.1 MAG: hypothetical protein EAZ99_19535 [Alphaproteobacteria bacterium]